MTKKTFLFLFTLTLAVTILFMACSNGGEEYTVTFDKNTDNAGATEANPRTKTVTEGGTVTLPAPPIRSNYQFGGWYTVSAKIGGTQFLATTPVTKNITVYARWWNLQATVIFHLNIDGVDTNNNPTKTVTGGSTVTLPASPERSDYLFTGWNTKRDGTGFEFTGTTIVPDDIIVYAQWEQREANLYLVTFDKNNGDTEASPKQTQVKQGAIKLPSTEPTKAGFKFVGWFTAPTGGTPFTATTPVSRDITVYAQWEEVKVKRTITFNVNGGTGTVGPIQVTVGEPLTNLPTSASRDGYTFTGWFDAASGGTKYTTSSVMPDKNLELFAQWQASSSGGGSDTIVWEPKITASTGMDKDNEYIGNFGIQRGANASELTLTPIANGFKATVVSGTYKRIIIQTPNAGGTNYYTNPDGFTACATGKDYTITFMVSVESGTGQLRANANGAPSGDNTPWGKDQALTTTPTEFSYSWTQGSGNLVLDTGNTAAGGVITITNIKVTSSSGGSGNPGGPGETPGANVVWQPEITASTTMNSSGEYIGNTGIQRASGASELTLAAIANGFTATVTSGTYKQINIQVGTAAGGTSHYATEGFIAATGTTYTITFMASVASGTGQLRAGANNNASDWEKKQDLSSTPATFTYTWTQGSGNLKLDTGNTAANVAITITGIKITSP